jgi:colicin import membrane protein
VLPLSRDLENSVLVSLEEVLDLERQRIEDDKAQQRAAKARQRDARLAAERAEREADEARQNAVLRERQARADEERERQARLEAIHEAEIAKAKAVISRAGEIEASELRHRHEREIEAARGLQRIKNLKLVIFSQSLLVVVAGTALWLLFRSHTAEDERKRALDESRVAELGERIDSLTTEIAQNRQENTTLFRELHEARRKLAARDEAPKAALAAGTKAGRVPQAPGREPPAVPKTPPSRSGPKGGCGGDPLCTY